jgi:hypothetical protein
MNVSMITTIKDQPHQPKCVWFGAFDLNSATTEEGLLMR